MKKHDIIIALLGFCVALLLVLSSCSLPGTTNGGETPADGAGNATLLEKEAIDNFLTNTGKDTSNVPTAPSLG